MSATEAPGAPAPEAAPAPAPDVHGETGIDMDAALAALSAEEGGEEEGASVDSEPGKKDAQGKEKSPALSDLQKQFEGLDEASKREFLKAFDVDDAAFAAITNKNRKLQARERKYAEQIAAFEKERESFGSVQTALVQQLELAHQSPEEALKLGGFSLDDVVDYIMNDGKLGEERLRKQYESSLDARLKKEREDVERRFSDLEKEKAQVQEQQIVTRLEQVARSIDPAEFPTMAGIIQRDPSQAREAAAAMMKLQKDVMAANNGKSVDWTEIAKYLEGRLTEQRRLLVGDEPPRERAPSPESVKPPISLTSKQTSERATPKPVVQEDDDLPFEELRARAVAALRGS